MNLGKFYQKKDDFVSKEVSLEKVIHKMYNQRLRYIVIVDSKHYPIGILTERDILFLYNTNINLKTTSAYDIATKQLIKADKSREIQYALNFMIDHNIRRVIVVDDKHKYLGVVEQEDIIFELESQSDRNQLKIFEVLLSESKAYGVDKNTTLEKTSELMKSKNFGSILITEHGKSIGILTETDILNLVKQNIDKKQIVQDYMHAPIHKVSIQASIYDCISLMKSKGIRRVIVEEVTQSGEIVDYIITTKDILNNMQGNYSKFLEAKLLSQKNTFESLEDIVIEAYDFQDTQVVSWANKSAINKLGVCIDDSLATFLPKSVIKKSLKQCANGKSFIKERVQIQERLYRLHISCTNMFGTQTMKILLSDFTELYLTNEKLATQIGVMSDSISEQEEMQKEIFNQNAIGIGYMSTQGEILFVNKYIVDLLGYEVDELIGQNIEDFTYSEDIELSLNNKQIVIDSHKEEDITYEKRFIHKDKSLVWVHISLSSATTKDGQTKYLIGFVQDIRERKINEKRLLLAEAVFDNTNEGLIIANRNLTIRTVNYGFEKMLGYSKKEIKGKSLEFFISHHHDASFYKQIWQKVFRKGYWQGEIWGIKKNGESFPQWLNIATIRDKDGKIINYIGALSDISVIKKSKEKLEFLAHHDPLTKLPNRLLLVSNLEHAIKRAKRDERKIAILFLDLDKFKDINDTFGHSYGDEILKAVTIRFQEVMREEDTIARIGGDEFIILIEDIKEITDIEIVLSKILSIFKSSFIINKDSFNLSASIGISVYPDDGIQIEDLVKNADTAMYQAKDEGRNTYRFYKQEMTQDLFSKIHLKNDIDKALQNHEFTLYYQPQINIKTQKLIGAEALVRWNHPQKGFLLPGEFIEEAENTKQIIALGTYVLEKACSDVKNWIDQGIFNGKISVNVSAIQIKQENFYDIVISVLQKTGLAGHFLDLELTESYMMENPKDSIALFNKLRKHGITLSIDDFGTGYSSLSYLKQLPVDKLKIDRSFIKEIPYNKEDTIMTKTIVAMSKSLGHKVIAEGVETTEQHDFLEEEGCCEGQGYLYSHPISPEDFEIFLKG